jgi:hypothetical protein
MKPVSAQFKKIQLPIQSEQEVRAVVAKGNKVANAKREASDSVFEQDLRKIAKEEKGSKVETNLRAKQAADYKFMPNLSEREHGELQKTQNRFERSTGSEKEAHRKTIGKAIQKGVVDSRRVTRLACQTPGCGSSVSMESSKGDVTCPSCTASGDKAGATYKDRPKTVVTGDRSDVGTRRASA